MSFCYNTKSNVTDFLLAIGDEAGGNVCIITHFLVSDGVKL